MYSLIAAFIHLVFSADMRILLLIVIYRNYAALGNFSS